jgi:hypothetical protein
MAKTKYGKYIISGIPDKEKEKVAAMMKAQGKQPDEGPGKMLLYTDGQYNKGVYYFTTQWVYGPSEEGIPPITHDHSYNEYLGFFGSDTEHPEELCGEVELYIGGEKHTITKSCVVFIPKGVSHCPNKFKRVDKPIFYFATAPTTAYSKENTEKYAKK